MTVPKEKTVSHNQRRCYVGTHNGVQFTQASIGGYSGLLNKEAINQWKINNAIEYTLKHSNELIGQETPDIRRAVRSFLNAPGKAATRGSRIHAIIEELLVEGHVIDAPESEWVVPMIQDFMAEQEAEIVAIERTLVWADPDGQVLAVGTADAILRINGTVWLVDWKSGKRIYPDSAFTTAGYAMAQHYLIDGVTIPIPENERVERVVVCHVKPSGLNWYVVRDHQQLEPVYRALLALADWTDNISLDIFE